MFLGIFFFLSFPLRTYSADIDEKNKDTRTLISPERKAMLLPEDLKARYQEIVQILPGDKKRVFLSVADRLSLSSLRKLVELLADKSLQEIIEFIDELYLMKDPLVQERYIVSRYIKKSEEVSVVERFYTIGPEIGIAPTVLKQVGYDVVYPKPPQKVSVQFISQGYVLGPGDSVFVYAWGRVRLPEAISFPMMLTVLHDGRVFIPLVGPVHIGGMTIESASEIIRSAVRKILGDVEVAVSLSSLKSIPVVVMGEVRKPGIIIISGTLSVFEAIQEAGGVKPSGSLRNIEIKRNGKTIAQVDLYDLIFKGLSEKILGGITLNAWDIVFVPRIGSTFAIVGSVKSQGIYEMKDKRMKLDEAIKISGGFIPDHGVFRVRVKRFTKDRREIVFDALVGEGDTPVFDLLDGDIVEVFPAYLDMEERYIFVSGYVRKSQKIPYVKDMNLKDVVMLSGGFISVEPPYAYEIIRHENGSEKRKYVRIPEEIRDKGIDKIIEFIGEETVFPYDRITIYPPPENEVPKHIEVMISGEVLFPGTYLMQRGDRLYDLLKKAGGFTPKAYPKGTVFIRQALKEEQMRKLEFVLQILTKEMVSEYSSHVQIGGIPVRQQPEDISDRIRVVRYLMELGGITGRVVLRLPQNIEDLKDSGYNIELQPKDEVIIPRVPDHVMVAGEVKFPSTFAYVPGRSLKFYVELAGGYTKYANKSDIFIIRANGEACTDLSKVEPGDTIIVPPRVKIPYETWYIVRDALSLSFQGLTAGALMLNALK